ncbi:MAG: glycoside hydrolase family 127 protein, partial [Oscillospiraceae bacterium]|nr:glycoside hydrolase family 127 protein [Oscillospiraceae bacterium]
MRSKKKLIKRLFVCMLAVLILTTLAPAPAVFAALPGGSDVVSLAGGNIARVSGVTIEASYSNVWTGDADVQTARIIDGGLPTSTDPVQSANQAWNSWDTGNFPVTVTLTWPEPYRMDATRVMWWYDNDTTPDVDVSLPGNCVVQYNAGTTANPIWTNVSNMRNAAGSSVTTVGNAGGGVNANNRIWNGVTFDQLVTQQLRLSVSKGIGTGVGIGEWEVFGSVASSELYSATIQGDATVVLGKEHTYTASVISPGLTNVGYLWTLDNDNAVIVGDAGASTVKVRGDKEGNAKLSLKVTHESGVKEAHADFNITIADTRLSALPDSAGAVSLADGNIARASGVAAAASYSNTTNGDAATQTARVINGALGSGAGTSWNSWNTSSFPVTVTLTWPEPYLMGATRIMWWYDGTSSGSGVTLPGNCVVQYNAGTTANPIWTNVSNLRNAAGDPVTTVGNLGGGTNANNRIWNGVTFDPLVTQQLRLSISKGVGTGVGISEWEVFGSVAPTELYAATIQGDAAVFSGEEHTYAANVISPNLTDVGYLWTLDNDNAVIVGAADAATVKVRGDKAGNAKLSLKVTHESGVQEVRADFNIAITATELVSVSVAGDTRLLEAQELDYTSTVYTPGLTGVAYQWTLSNGSAAIVGADDAATVKLRGVAAGPVTLTVKAAHNSGAREVTADYHIDVLAVTARTYVTSTAAGKAPILPKRVVLENVRFDTPTAHTTGSFDFGEEFNDSLIAVDHWDDVPPELYAADKIGTTFEVAGLVKYKGVEYPAQASVTVKEALAAPDFNHSITSENVTFDDTFWKPKQLVNATSSFDAAFVQLSATSGSWAEERNFVNAKARLAAVAAGSENPPMGQYTGYVFADTDVYKTMEGVAYNLAAIWDDPSMDARKVTLQNKLDYWIGLIESIQYADGYINSAFSNRTSVSAGGSGTGNWRWRYMDRHEMYNIGHFLEGAVAYTRYREGVGLPDYRLYEVGKRAADHIVDFFGPGGKRVEVPGHEEIELGLMKMANLVEEYEGVGAGETYRETAKLLVDRRGNRTGANARQSGYNGGTYSQDRTPIISETAAVGHAVRAMYFYTGVTDVATWLAQNDPSDAAPYLSVMDRIWENASERNTYITGGVGSAQPGASSEGFGADYALSNTQSYCEICAAIAMSNWNQRLNLVHEDAKYADSYEKSLYNATLVGVNLAGGRFYYSTPIERTTTGSSRHLWESVACCEPNVLRTIANMGGYLYTVKQDSVFVNMYAGSTADVNVEGTNVKFAQVTNYPWDGVINMTVTPAESKEFTLNIRVPGWVKAQKYQEVTIEVDGERIDATPNAKGYVAITRIWPASGAVLDIDIPMEVRITEADNNVYNIGTATHSNRNRIAIERGPIVYCLEDAGTGASTANTFNATQVVFPRTMELTPVWRPDLLRGVVALTGTALYNGEEREVTLTPYYAWNNRGTDPANLGNGATNGSGRMVVWANASEATVQIRGAKDRLDTNEETSLMAVPHVNFSAGASAMPSAYRWTVSGPGEVVGEPVYAQAPTSGYEKIGGVVGGVATNTVAYYASTAKVRTTGSGLITVTVEALNGENTLYTDTYEIAAGDYVPPAEADYALTAETTAGGVGASLVNRTAEAVEA